MNSIGEKAVLMRLSIGLPGEFRQDNEFSAEVKQDKHLGQQAGNWVKRLYPPEALARVKKVDNAARAYHAAVTLPFDQGTGILPVGLIKEHTDRMRAFKGERDALIDEFLADPQKWVDWAKAQHNGTFDPDQYPGCSIDESTGNPVIDCAEFQSEMRRKFDFGTCPLPVPEASHFSQVVSQVLGTDAESVNLRVADATIEANRELLRRMLEPVVAMAKKLAEAPKQKKDGTTAEDIVFRDSLVGNLQDIARLAPELNLSDDPQIAAFCKEIDGLARYSPKALRDDKNSRAEAQKKADELARRMSAYQF